MAACAGELHKTQGKRTIGKVQPVSSLAYLVRMHLFDYVNLDPGLEIEEHEEAGRFIPLTQIRTSDDLHSAIVNLIPLLHAEPEVADPIKYVFSEMVRNVLEHAKSPVGAIVCAQYYRNKERLSIGIADAGRGILKSIRKSHAAADHADAIRLALTPGVTGATKRIGGNEFNAGAGLFFTKSIAALSRNFFAIYSGDCLYKLQRGSQVARPALHPNPLADNHSFTKGLPPWQGTIVGINVSVKPGQAFEDLLGTIRESYRIDVKKAKKQYYKQVRFTT